VLTALAGCGSSSSPTPAASPAASSPAASPPSGLVNGSRCAALRVQVQSNVQALQLEQAAGHTDQVQQLQTQIAASRTAARAIPGCDVSDLIPR
jgi:hypothetical protein